MPVTQDMLDRFNAHTATEADLRAILEDDRASARPCPDLQRFLSPILWQLERQDYRLDAATGEWIECDNPTMADAMAALASVEA